MNMNMFQRILLSNQNNAELFLHCPAHNLFYIHHINGLFIDIIIYFKDLFKEKPKLEHSD